MVTAEQRGEGVESGHLGAVDPAWNHVAREGLEHREQALWDLLVAPHPDGVGDGLDRRLVVVALGEAVDDVLDLLLVEAREVAVHVVQRLVRGNAAC